MQEKTPMSQRIFLADDELIVRQALCLLLEQAGFVIIGEACDAENLLTGMGMQQ